MRFGGFVTGVLGLAALQAATANKNNTANASKLITLPVAVVTRLVDPSVPLVPNWHDNPPATQQVADALSGDASPAPAVPSPSSYVTGLPPTVGPTVSL